jgi:hypothetical protein
LKYPGFDIRSGSSGVRQLAAALVRRELALGHLVVAAIAASKLA